MRFILLTSKSGDKVRYNISLIMHYYSDEGQTVIEMTEGTYYVRESPEEIDSILITNGILVHG